MGGVSVVISVSVSVAELFPVFGSDGVVTEAVFTRLPEGAPTTVAETTYVTLAPNGRSTVSLMLPAPLAVHVPPVALEQVHVALAMFGFAAFVRVRSVTVAPMTSDGPALYTVMVYVFVAPATYSVELSVFVICKSDDAVDVSVSVAELLALLVSV